MALAENYPNSKVASDALMLAAKRYEDTDKPRMATQVLRRLNWKYNNRFSTAERAALIEAMARNYLKVGNLGAALGRLQKGNSPLEIWTRTASPQLEPETRNAFVPQLTRASWQSPENLRALCCLLSPVPGGAPAVAASGAW